MSVTKKKSLPRGAENIGGITSEATVPSERELDRIAKYEGKTKKKLDAQSERRLEQILSNKMLEVKLGEQKLPIEREPVSSTIYEGLMEYKIPSTHLRLLGMADPSQEPTVDQRREMARRLNDVGKFLPRYIKSVALRPGSGITPEEATESAEVAKGDNARRKVVEEAAGKRREGPTVSRTERVSKMTKKADAAPALVNGVPLKKLCQQVQIDPKDARAILRSKKVEKPGGRWEWPADKAEGVKKILEEGKKELAK